jgi:hypothetical protein
MNDSEHVTDKKAKTIVGALLLFWLVLAFILGANDAFAREPGALPLLDPGRLSHADSCFPRRILDGGSVS